jgi:hypothetical protein
VLVVVLVLDPWDCGAGKESPILRPSFCSITLDREIYRILEDEPEHAF